MVALDLDPDDACDASVLEQIDRREPVYPIRDKDERTHDQLASLVPMLPPVSARGNAPVAVGRVIGYAGEFAIVQANSGLEIDSWVVNERGEPNGRVIDVFGPVTDPRLIVTGKHSMDETVFIASGLCHVPALDELIRRSPACDASGRDDRAVLVASSDDDNDGTWAMTPISDLPEEQPLCP